MRSSVPQLIKFRLRSQKYTKRRVIYKAFSKNLFFSDDQRFSAYYKYGIAKTDRFIHSSKFRNYCFVIRKYGSFYSATKINRHMSRRYLITGFFPGYRLSSW